MGMCCNGTGSWFSMMLAAAVGAGVAVAVMSGSDGTAGAEAKPAALAQPEQPEMDMDAMMEAWMEVGTPGEHHALLEKFVGEWNAVTSFQMSPDEDPISSEGTEANMIIMDGRFVYTEHHGDFMGEPFEGSGVMGYDNIQKKFVSAWIDSMSTMIYNETGDYDPDTQTFTMLAKMTEPSGMKMDSKHVHKFNGDDKRTLEFFQRPEGTDEWMKSGTITYTRK